MLVGRSNRIEPRKLFGGHLPAMPSAAAILAALLLIASSTPVLAQESALEAGAAESRPVTREWTMNMYQANAVRFQNPDWQACTAASAESMLNLITLNTAEVAPIGPQGHMPTPAMRWQFDNSYDMQHAILLWERDHMTMSRSYPGSDPHGWRNALNHFGWGSVYAGVYVDTAYPSFDAAARATVSAIARFEKPVGILGWFGAHAQMVTGYTVRGEDPRIGDDWTIAGVYITDPLQADNIRNTYVRYEDWRYGPLYFRFSPYWQNESFFPDPLDGTVGYRVWRGKWVIINPVK
jgi:hypothetical protein